MFETNQGIFPFCFVSLRNNGNEDNANEVKIFQAAVLFDLR